MKMKSKNEKKLNTLKNDIGSLLNDASWQDDEGGFLAQSSAIEDDVINEAAPQNKQDQVEDQCSSNDIQLLLLNKENELKEFYEKKLREQETKLKREISNREREKPLHPTLSPETISEQFLDLFGGQVTTLKFTSMLSRYDTWDSSTKRLLNLIIKHTKSGNIINVPIPRIEIEKIVHSSSISSAKNFLLDKNIISITEGCLPNTRKSTLFFTLNLQSFVNFLSQ